MTKLYFAKASKHGEYQLLWQHLKNVAEIKTMQNMVF
jgi:hypothetical protein